MRRIGITGASGLIGRALIERLHGQQQVVAFTRDPASHAFAAAVETRRFDPNGDPNPSVFEGLDTVIHLAGESVAGRWTKTKKERIYSSRVEGTRTLAMSIAQTKHAPSIVVCASAVGFYGDRGDECLTESSEPGNDFLARVCVDWERASQTIAQQGLRVAIARTGIVLSKTGGALGQMMSPFKLGLGGPFGSGKQFVPWIHLADLVQLYLWLVEHEVRGAVNGVAPSEVTSKDFASALGGALHRPAILPAPGLALRIALGEFARTILASQRVIPDRAKAMGFTWKFADLDSALRDCVTRL